MTTTKSSSLLVDFENTINERIKELKDSKHPAHNLIYNESLNIQIETLQWALAELFTLKRKQ